MFHLKEIAERVRALFRPAGADAEMDEELRFHIEMETEKNLRRGMDPGEARRRALIAFGGVERYKEQTREERGVRPVENLVQDLRFTLRTIRKNPGFALTAVLTLALGIGATTLVFSVFNTVVLRPLPFEDPDALVRVREVTPQNQLMSVSDPNFLDFRTRSRSFEEMAAVSIRPLVLTGGEAPVRISGLNVSQGFFEMLRVRPILGRVFDEEEYRVRGEAGTVVLGYNLWMGRYGGDPDLLGTAILMDGVPRVVVGILPGIMVPPLDMDAWLPFTADPGFPRGDHRREVFARLAPGVTLDAARQDLLGVQQRLGETYPASNQGWGVSLVRFREWIIGPEATRVSQVLLGAVGLLLLLACASVSNLLLARATTRQREISLRAALGAGKARILFQLLVESGTLALLGGGAGLLLAYTAIPVVRSLPAAPLPRLDQVELDVTVLTFTLAASILSALVFGLAPVFQGFRRDLIDDLRTGGRLITIQTRRLRDGLVVGQLALATVLLAGAGLLTTSFLRMASVEPGFDVGETILTEISLPLEGYGEMSPATGNAYAEMLDAVREVPGVEAAGATMASPVSDFRPTNTVARSDAAADRDAFVHVAWRAVTPGFFPAMGIPLRAGEIFTDQAVLAQAAAYEAGDDPGPIPVVISRALGERLWPEGAVVGRILIWNGPDGEEMLVSGVVENVRDLSFPGDSPPTIYLPQRMVAWPTMTLIIRARGGIASVAGPVREAIWSVNPGIPVPDLQSMEEALFSTLAGPRLNTILMGFFSASALLLAAVGLFGLTALAVTMRSGEIGVRMALGAPDPNVLGLILKKAAGLVVVGLVLGMGGALFLGRFVESILFGVEATNPLTYLAVVVVLGSVTLAASVIPARRALRVDPTRCLQAD